MRFRQSSGRESRAGLGSYSGEKGLSCRTVHSTVGYKVLNDAVPFRESQDPTRSKKSRFNQESGSAFLKSKCCMLAAGFSSSNHFLYRIPNDRQLELFVLIRLVHADRKSTRLNSSHVRISY